MTDTAEITVCGDDHDVVIACSGALDLGNTEPLKEGIVRSSAVAEALAVDLRHAEFIDTAVLEHLARGAKAMANRGKRFKVIALAGSHPLRVLRTVGFDAMMDLVVAPAAADD